MQCMVGGVALLHTPPPHTHTRSLHQYSMYSYPRCDAVLGASAATPVHACPVGLPGRPAAGHPLFLTSPPFPHYGIPHPLQPCRPVLPHSSAPALSNALHHRLLAYPFCGALPHRCSRPTTRRHNHAARLLIGSPTTYDSATYRLHIPLPHACIVALRCIDAPLAACLLCGTRAAPGPPADFDALTEACCAQGMAHGSCPAGHRSRRCVHAGGAVLLCTFCGLGCRRGAIAPLV